MYSFKLRRMSCDRLQSRSAQIAFSVSSNGFGSLKAVKHSGDVCCVVLKCFSLLVPDEVRQVRMRWLVRSAGVCANIQVIAWLGLESSSAKVESLYSDAFLL
jgi:hypothetical protein